MAVRSWQQGRRAPTWRFHVGLMLAGWGLFNLVEGIVDHQVLGVHHVRDDLGAPLSWDLGFLAFGALLVVGGWLLHRSGVRGVRPGDAPATARGTALPEDPRTRVDFQGRSRSGP